MKQRDHQGPQLRRDTIKSHLIQEHRHDPYKSSGKLAEPSVCPECSAVYEDGRWQWHEGATAAAQSQICPACQRIADKFPAGELTLTGGFVSKHKDEIIGLLRHVEAAEKREHPLQRIMGLDETDGLLVVTTTDIHLPRRLGHALEGAYKGDLDTHYDEAGYFVRMTWNRDA